MAQINNRNAALLAAVLAVAWLGAPAARGEERSICWDDGASTHNWTDADNWLPSWGGGPRNGYWEFLVTIGCETPGHPGGEGYNPVYFDAPAPPVEITDFFLSNNSKLVLDPGTDLTVLRTAEIAGIIDAQGGHFTACGTSTDLTGCRSRIYALYGSNVSICAPTYCSKDLWADSSGWNHRYWDLMKAEGNGSLLDLSTVISIDGGSVSTGDYNHQQISAVTGGVVDLSGVTTITGPQKYHDDLNFIIDPGSGDPGQTKIDLTSVEMIGATYAGYSQQTCFNIQGGALQLLPALQEANQVEFLGGGGSTFVVPNLTQLTNSTFLLTDASQFSDDEGEDQGMATYRSTGIWADSSGWNHRYWDLMKAEGNGSLLDLSTVTSIDGGSDSTGDYNHQQISAVTGGVVDLSGVTTITGPQKYHDDLNFIIDPGSGDPGQTKIDLTSVEMIGATYAGYSQQTRFNIQGGALQLLPALQEANQVEFLGAGGSTFVAPNLTQLTNSTFLLTDASQFSDDEGEDEGTATYRSTGIWADSSGWNHRYWDLMKAEGNGSLLDLSTVISIDGGSVSTGDYNHQQISAVTGGVVDLSGVTTITGPQKYHDDLNFIIDPGSGDPGQTKIDLTSVEMIGATYAGYSQQTCFNIQGGALQLLPALQEANQVEFLGGGGSTFVVPNLTQLTNSTFLLTDASQFSDDEGEDQGMATYRSTGIWADSSGWNHRYWDLMKAEGGGSLLDLSTVTSIDGGSASTGDYNHQQISAVTGGMVDLSGVTTITGPQKSHDDLNLIAHGADSVLDMQALRWIGNGAEDRNADGRGKVRANVANGGHMRLGHVHVQMGHENEADVSATLDLNTDALLSVASLRATSPVHITLNTATDRLEISGSLLLGTNITIDAAAGATLSVGGDFLHRHGEPSDDSLNLGSAIVECVGNAQRLEVAGTEYGPVWDPGMTDHNFGFRQLVIGGPGNDTVVELVDLYDNLDREFADALYLFGNEEECVEGLRILGGSTLVLHDLNVYALLDIDEDCVLERVSIHSLFEPGETTYHFSHNGNDGYITFDAPPLDCNDNEIPDECDLDCGEPGGPCDVPGCGNSADCTNNAIPDECDIANGTASDLDGDSVPDECFIYDGGGDDNNWNTSENWETDVVPNERAIATIDGALVDDPVEVDLDVLASIDSLRLLNAATLNVTGEVDEDLTTARGALVAGNGDGSAEARLWAGNGRTISIGNAGIGRLELTSGGVYEAAPDADASATLTASEVYIASNACEDIHAGRMELTGTMTADVTGDFIIVGNTGCPGFPSTSSDRGGVTSPIKKTGDDAQVKVGGTLRLQNAVQWINDSSRGVELAGDFDNRATAPSLFDWTEGKLLLNGTSRAEQVVEVAGLDLGATLAGFHTTARTLWDVSPHTNFVIDEFAVADDTEVRFVNATANTAGDGVCEEAIYIDELIVGQDATLTAENCRVYYRTLDDHGGTMTSTGQCGGFFELCLWTDIRTCFAGPDVNVTQPECATFDFDQNDHIDLADVAVFQNEFGQTN